MPFKKELKSLRVFGYEGYKRIMVFDDVLNLTRKYINDKVEYETKKFERRFKAVGKLMDFLSRKVCPCSTCCCSGCVQNGGYFHTNDAVRIAVLYGKNGIETVKNLFNPDKGFLAENGCVLPRDLRSRTCTSMICLKMENLVKPRKSLSIGNFLGEAERQLLSTLEDSDE